MIESAALIESSAEQFYETAVSRVPGVTNDEDHLVLPQLGHSPAAVEDEML
jgi:hypothetical protein